MKNVFGKFIRIVAIAAILMNSITASHVHASGNVNGNNSSANSGLNYSAEAGKTIDIVYDFENTDSITATFKVESDNDSIIESIAYVEEVGGFDEKPDFYNQTGVVLYDGEVSSGTITIRVTLKANAKANSTAEISFMRFVENVATGTIYADDVVDTITVKVDERHIDAPSNVTISGGKAEYNCGETVSLTASASGEGAISYKWFVGGAEKASGAQWQFDAVTYPNSTITLEATNAGGTTPSGSSFSYTVNHGALSWTKDAHDHYQICGEGHVVGAKEGHYDSDKNGICDKQECGHVIDSLTPSFTLERNTNDANRSNTFTVVGLNNSYGYDVTYEWKVDGQIEENNTNSLTLDELLCEKDGLIVEVTVTFSNGKSDSESSEIDSSEYHKADSDNVFHFDGDEHYKDYDCGHEYEREDHEPLENGKLFHDDDSHFQKCECGYPIPGTDVGCSDADNLWNTSNTEHWHECECGNIIDKAQHEDTDYDGKCDTCEHAVDVEAPSITTQPKDVTKNFGEDATFSVVAQGKGTLTYTWYVKEPNETDFRPIATGETLAVDDVTCEMNGFKFKVVVSNVDNDTVESNVVTLTVNGHDKDTDGVYSSDANGHWVTYDCGHEGNYDPHVDNGTISGTVKNDGICDICGYDQLPILLTITTQPTAQTVNHGESVTFTVEAQGDGVTYQWYADDQPIAGANSATYTHTAECTENGTMIKVVVTETTGDPNESKTSNAVKLTVNETYEAEWSHDANHHWHASNCGNIEHAKDKDGHKDSNEDGTCDVCQRTGLPLNLKITKQPVKQTVNAGETATFSVEVKGNAPFTYQWYVGGQPVAGATNAEFTFTAKCTDNNAEVYVTVSDADNDGSISSTPVKLTVNEVYESGWSYNDTHHWHAGTCGNSGHMSGYEAHKDLDEDGACDICTDIYPHTRVRVVEFDKDAALDENHPFNAYISDTMQQNGLDTVEKVFNKMLREMQGKKSKATTENTVIIEAELQYFDESAGTWVEADETHWPASGTLTVTLPYPEGTNAKNYKFYVGHMFTEGANVGEFEWFTPSEKSNGLVIAVTGLSPFIIYYEKEVTKPGGGSSIVIPDTAVKGIDYSALISALEAASKLDGEGAEWMLMLEAMNRATNLLDSDNQYAVDKAAAELNNAIDSLIVVQGNPVQSSGMNTGLAVAGVAAIAVLALILALNKKRKYNDNTPVVEYNISDDNN